MFGWRCCLELCGFCSYSQRVKGIADAQQSPFPPHGDWHACLTDSAVGWAGTVRMGLAFAIVNPLDSPWAFNGLRLSRYPHWRRAGRGPGCLLAICCPAAHRCRHTRPPHRAAGAAVDDIGKSGTGGYFCRHHAPSMCPGYRNNGSWRAVVVGGQHWLAVGLASATGRAMVEWLPGADHCRGASGIEPFVAAVCATLHHVSTGSEHLASWTPAPCGRLGVWWTCHRAGDAGSGLVVAAV